MLLQGCPSLGAVGGLMGLKSLVIEITDDDVSDDGFIIDHQDGRHGPMVPGSTPITEVARGTEREAPGTRSEVVLTIVLRLRLGYESAVGAKARVGLS